MQSNCRYSEEKVKDWGEFNFVQGMVLEKEGQGGGKDWGEFSFVQVWY